jgi:phage gp36-like protein
MLSSSRPSRAVELLAAVVTQIDRDTVARELVVSAEMIDAYLAMRLAIPLERQLCLALFTIDRTPMYARAGQRLRAQVLAAIAFHAHATLSHSESRPGAWW